MKYIVTGYIKSNLQLNKEFKTLKKANRYLDNVLLKYDCQVEESESKGNLTEYVCDDYTRFFVEERI